MLILGELRVREHVHSCVAGRWRDFSLEAAQEFLNTKEGYNPTKNIFRCETRAPNKRGTSKRSAALTMGRASGSLIESQTEPREWAQVVLF